MENTQEPRKRRLTISTNVVEESGWVRDIFQMRTSYNTEIENDEDTQNDNPSILMILFVLGCCAGLINGLIGWAASEISKFQVYIIKLDPEHTIVGLIYFWMVSSTATMIAAFMCKFVSKFAAGSGVPEYKYLVNSDAKEQDYERYLSWRVFVAKVLGLICSNGSGLPVGSEGPLVHITACMAYLLLTNVGEFGDMLQSASLRKQIFAASAAVGVSSAFNAPVGGLLFSIEVTATYYLVSNYWKSFIAAVTGSVACNLFLISKGATSDPLLILHMPANSHPFVKWELLVFFVMGIVIGVMALGYLKFHQQVFLFMRPLIKSRPLLLVLVVTLVNSTLIYYMKAYYGANIGVLSMVSDVLASGRVVELHDLNLIPPLAGLFVTLSVRIVLTSISTHLPIPAGIFMPSIFIGGIAGRIIGTVLQLILSQIGNYHINVASYSLVGACAFAGGVTHTISVAVIVIELTGNLPMLLPCLMVTVIAAGITKAHGYSIYDQGMINKGLESVQLLLMESKHRRFAGDIMDDVSNTISLNYTLTDLTKLLEATQETQDLFPIVNTQESMTVVGTVSRMDLYIYLETRYRELDKLDILQKLLCSDHTEHSKIMQRAKQKRSNSIARQKLAQSARTVLDSISESWQEFVARVFPPPTASSNSELFQRPSEIRPPATTDNSFYETASIASIEVNVPEKHRKQIVTCGFLGISGSMQSLPVDINNMSSDNFERGFVDIEQGLNPRAVNSTEDGKVFEEATSYDNDDYYLLDFDDVTNGNIIIEDGNIEQGLESVLNRDNSSTGLEMVDLSLIRNAGEELTSGNLHHNVDNYFAELDLSADESIFVNADEPCIPISRDRLVSTSNGSLNKLGFHRTPSPNAENRVHGLPPVTSEYALLVSKSDSRLQLRSAPSGNNLLVVHTGTRPRLVSKGMHSRRAAENTDNNSWMPPSLAVNISDVPRGAARARRRSSLLAQLESIGSTAAGILNIEGFGLSRSNGDELVEISSSVMTGLFATPEFSEAIDVVNQFGFAINSTPFSVTTNTPMEHVYVLFEMVRAQGVLVVTRGKLVGMISRSGLLKSLRKGT